MPLTKPAAPAAPAGSDPAPNTSEARVPARFRFYAELNDFLARERRGGEFEHQVTRSTSVKHAIEALGVPHTEVELILVNGRAVGFAERLRAGDRVSVYPKFETFDVAPLVRLRPQPLRVTRFIADAHLGGLARLLRMAGFDTVYDNGLADDAIEALAAREARIILSRDRELLKRRTITHGCYVRALKPELQFSEILARLDLSRSVRPLSRCLECNTLLRPVAREEVEAGLPPRVRAKQARFSSCESCRRVYWEGSHWRGMVARIDRALAAAESEAATSASRGEQE